jgi:hypothetical protein
MAIKLTLPPSSRSLFNSSSQTLRYYVKIAGLHFLTEQSDCTVPLSYRELDDQDQPVGPFLSLTSLPASATIWNPRELMMSTTRSAYELAYEAVALHLRNTMGAEPLLENLL